MLNQLIAFFAGFHFNASLALIFAELSLLIGMVIIAMIINWVLKHYIVRFALMILRRSHTVWAMTLLKHNIFKKLSHIGPGLFIYLVGKGLLASSAATWTAMLAQTIETLAILYVVFTVTCFLLSFMDAAHEYLQNLSCFHNYPLNSYVQILKIILWICTLILAISFIFNTSPWAFLTGLGALSAVLLLVFKDTILGFVANIQVSAYDMVRVGDWVTIPSFQVDGDVLEVGVNSVKVRNFDNTVSTIPTYALVSNGLQNWRAMAESGGRRIKRSLNVDIDTVHFCSDALLKQLSLLEYLKEYIPQKFEEIKNYNQIQNVDTSISVNGRNLTNIGLFRAYVQEYLKHNPKIHKNMTLMVRQLQPTPTGLPLEVYVFSNDTNWVNYEGIQADIFDHLFAALPLFELRAFQTISGRMDRESV